jgi:hypothetical protein
MQQQTDECHIMAAGGHAGHGASNIGGANAFHGGCGAIHKRLLEVNL